MKKSNVGSSFDSWLREEGIYEEVTAKALKRVLARQVEAAMKEKQLSKAEMARRMRTSRAALARLLDPDYDAVTLKHVAQSGGRRRTRASPGTCLDRIHANVLHVNGTLRTKCEPLH